MRLIRIFLLLLVVLVPWQASAQGNEPVVYGVFFYSPTCPHCHLVIQNDYPRMQAEFGDQFRLLFINVQTPGGEALFRAAYNAPHLAVNSLGVPTMIIGDVVMVGSVEIPAVAFDVIREGIAAGGIGLPDIPGLREAYEAYLAQEGNVAPEAQPADAASGGGGGQIIAVIVLGVLAVSLLAVLSPLFTRKRLPARRWASGFVRSAAPNTAVLGVAAGLTLIGEAASTPPVFALALVVVAALASVVFGLWKNRHSSRRQLSYPEWLIPVAAACGLVVAGYLAYVEMTQAEAVCGLVGGCNLVQQSDYARLFGLVPVGLAGVAGYVVMLALWYAGRRSLLARGLLLVVCIAGVAFSIYLTFLEAFVIGAVCMWCITSALVMALLLWLAAPGGWDAITQLRTREEMRAA